MSQARVVSSVSSNGALLEIARLQDWWNCKFSPVLATFYASAYLIGIPVWPLLPKLLVLLLSLTVGATYVSIINDWADQSDDAAGGKYNRVANKPAWATALAVGLCLTFGLASGIYFWQTNHLSGWLYLGSWVAFSAYSFPPLRLKKRGLAGVLADASGSHLFPQLLTVSLVAAWAGQQLPAFWYGALGTWALTCGLRNILLHQLSDAEADAQADVDTWVLRRGPQRAQWFGQAVLFPIELAAFCSLLAMSQQLWSLVLLLVYAALEGLRWRLWGSPPRILQPQTRILLGEYYEVFYPLAFLIALSSRHHTDGIVLLVHLVLFGTVFWQPLVIVGRAIPLAIHKILGKLR
ncbi:UbiA family prenyltransferase [Hymenobacter sp. UYP22]|uniref:UbiA family prenyltransferase n=1 Tax=Hymenobacter sp. UYP22 TaxID=3156348 RepID=UPI00339431C7